MTGAMYTDHGVSTQGAVNGNHYGSDNFFSFIKTKIYTCCNVWLRLPKILASLLFLKAFTWLGFSFDILQTCQPFVKALAIYSKAIYISPLSLYFIFITNNLPLWLHEIIRNIFNYCMQPLITMLHSESGDGWCWEKRQRGGVNAELVMYYKCQVTEKLYIFT